MRLSDLRQAVHAANMDIFRRGLAQFTFGNVSGIDRASGMVVIKPSGVPYESMTPESMVIVDLDNRVVEGALKPSSDTRTHTALYRAWSDIGGITHTHSTHATAWCQARRALPCLGTTHADHCHGPVPCTAVLTDKEVAGDYEEATGQQILTAFANLDHVAVPMVLVAGHAPFTWGESPAKAAYNAGILEEVARMACLTLAIDPTSKTLPAAIADKHYFRKHGANATYGQNNPGKRP